MRCAATAPAPTTAAPSLPCARSYTRCFEMRVQHPPAGPRASGAQGGRPGARVVDSNRSFGGGPMRIALLLHLLGATVWIGGMFFAYTALRPAAARLLQPPQRLPLWRATLGRFFTWVWISIVALYGSGLHMLASAYGVRAAPAYVVAMAAIATVMTAIFVYVCFVPFRALARAVDAQDCPAGGAALNRIRQLVATNLVLGLLTIVVAVAGGLLG